MIKYNRARSEAKLLDYRNLAVSSRNVLAINKSPAAKMGRGSESFAHVYCGPVLLV